jgi:hypothetical protein
VRLLLDENVPKPLHQALTAFVVNHEIVQASTRPGGLLPPSARCRRRKQDPARVEPSGGEADRVGVHEFAGSPKAHLAPHPAVVEVAESSAPAPHALQPG